MRIAYLDCFSGISGDMFLGALVDAGVSVELLRKTVGELGIDARLEISKVVRSGIVATKVDVYAHGEKDRPRDSHTSQTERGKDGPLELPDVPAQNAGRMEHPNSPPFRQRTRERWGTRDSHGHQTWQAGVPAPNLPGVHEHASHQHSQHEHSHGRTFREIKEIIEKAGISEAAKRNAVGMFEALGDAEAKIHGVGIESVHFHEVGAVDAIVDIVCAAVGAEALGVEEIVCSPLNVGGGTVHCSHGTFPVPAPATVELLKGAPVYSSGIEAELVTPTGAAIVKTLARRFASFPEMKFEKAGYGAGSRDFPGYPNVVRLTIGEAQSGLVAKTMLETISVLEANLDDLNPQVFGYVMDRLLEEGALDAFGIPVQMKKNRPGMLLTVLCRPEDAAKLTELIFAETTTLGIRRRDEQREVLARRWVNVSTPWGEVRMKVASMNGAVTNYAPEYEDCRRIAAEHHVPLKTVMQEAMKAVVGR